MIFSKTPKSEIYLKVVSGYLGGTLKNVVYHFPVEGKLSKIKTTKHIEFAICGLIHDIFLKNV